MKKGYKILTDFIIVAVLIVITYIISINVSNQNIVLAEKGVIDLSDRTYEQLSIVELGGEWEFYWEQLLTPYDFESKDIVTEYSIVPSNWDNTTVELRDKKNQGYCTYRFKLKLPDSNKTYSLKLPNIYSAYKIWIDGISYPSKGIVGTDKYSSEANISTQIIYFTSHNNGAEIIIQVSNFDTRYGGIKWYLSLAPSSIMSINLNIKMLGNIIFAVFLLIICLFFFVQYLLQRNDKKLLYFAFICITLCIRILCIGEGIVYQVFNMWNIIVRIEYIDLIFLLWANIKFYLEMIDEKTSSQIEATKIKFNNFIFVAVVVITILFGFLPIIIVSQLLKLVMVLTLIAFCILYRFLLMNNIKSECILILKTYIGVFAGFAIGNIAYSTGFSEFDYFACFSIVVCCINSLLIIKNSARIYTENKNINKHLETLVLEKTVELRFANATLHKLNEELKQKATTDSLTNLYNRRMFETLFLDELKDRSETKKISLIMFDIDFFKKVNDTYGHDAGDSVLLELANLSKSDLRKTDILARWGGEEFVALLPYTNADEGTLVAEKLRKSVEEHEFSVVGNITVSFGVAELKKDTLSSIIKSADECLYKAKNTGRNKVVNEKMNL